MEHLNVGQSWQAFRKEHRLGNWWLVLIPSIILSLITSAANLIPILGQILAILIPLVFTVYIYRIRMKLYLTKENTDFAEELKGLHYRRDFLAKLAWDIPVWIAITLAMIPLLLFFGSTVLWIINISYQYESAGGSLFSLLLFFLISVAVFMAIEYFISIPFRAVVFMAATDSKEIVQEGFDFSDVVTKAKLAWQIFKNYEYRNKIFLGTLIISLIMVLTGIFIIPLIWTVPFYNFFITRAYTEVLNDAGYDVTSWLDSRPANRIRVEDLAPAEVYDEPQVDEIYETGDQLTDDLQDSDKDDDFHL